METADAIVLATRLIETGEVHQDYKRVTDLASDYKIYSTGEGIDKKLVQFVKREDPVLFEQRKNLTKSITPAIASSVRTPFNKVSRNDRIRKDLTVAVEAHKPVIEKMIKRFYGAARKQNRGLEYWLKTRFLELSFIDPNAWVVVEWDAVQNPSEVITPRPFEVKASQAKNFYIENDEVHWLFVEQSCTFKKHVASDMKQAPANDASGVPFPKSRVPDNNAIGNRYTLYDEDCTLVFEQVDTAYMRENNVTINETFQQFVKIRDFDFVVSTYLPKIGYVPAFRIGYKRDETTEGRTFVNPWHDAMCYFEKTLKTVSEMDLTMTLHTFPQKIQYVQACQGVSKTKKCNGGYLSTGEACSACGGQGYKVHTSAQDAMLLPMPDNPVQADIVNLDNLLVYKAPPIETVKFQNEYILQLERQVHQSVFNSQVFIRKNNSTSIVGDGTQTATENDNNMQSVYDALEPFTEKLSELYIEFVTTFAIIAGEKDMEKISVIHVFPADYKLKTSDILLSERKAASDSGAPSFLLETIDDDLATIIYAGDPLAIQKYRVKRRYFPFAGKSPDEITEAVGSEFVPEAVKVLYMNFENIFKELERETPEFFLMADIKKQRELVDAMVVRLMEELAASKPTFEMDQFREDNPANGDASTAEEEDKTDWGGGAGNPATENPDDADEEKNPQ